MALRRRLFGVAGVVVAVAALAGCGGDGDTGAAVPGVSPTASPSPAAGSGGPAQSPSPAGNGSPAPASAQDPITGATVPPIRKPDSGTAKFVEVVRTQLSDVAAGRTSAEIAGIAEVACRGLAAGRPADDIVAGTRSLGTLDAEATDQATARELIKLAIDTVCLDQAGRVDEF